MRKPIVFVILFLIIVQLDAQKRYKSELFRQIDSVKNVEYGAAVNLKGNIEKLLLDVFLPPKEDTVKFRPLIIFIHGGGFKNNSKTGSYSASICNSFTKKGYVTATIDYRLGVGAENTNKDYAEALYRGQQDGKAAVRYFRKNAAQFGIDTSQIFITGTSAGSKICLAMAYLDENEVPTEIDQKKWGALEGSSGNEGYSSKVHGVLNQWGCLINYKWINSGDAPLFSATGTADKTVPYDSSFDYHGMKYGSLILYERCLSVGVATGYRPFFGAGHTLDNNKNKQDSCIKSMSDWLYTQLKIVKGNNEEGVLRWEKDINAFDRLNSVEKYSKNSIMFIGSSYIRLWENIRTDLQYNDIIHRGFGGCNFRDVAYYIKRIAYPHQPKAIFIYVGNDIVVSEKDKAPDQVLELYKYIVKCLRQKFPTIPITFLQISPNERRWASWDKISSTNDLIKAYCATESKLFYISSADQFLGKDGLPITKYFRDDKLHYNIEGYKVWGNHIKQLVKEISNK